MPLMIPNVCKSHKMTTITTITFKIVFIDPAIGIYVLISQSTKPTTIRTITIEMSDITILRISSLD